MAPVKLIQMQLPKNVHIGGLQTSLLESDKFEMLAYMDAGLVDVTVRRTGQKHLITFAGLMMTPDPAAIEDKKRKAG